VLTHEIMNSMTPVTSLAHTAAELMGTIDTGGNRDVQDARAAVDTLARRADGVMHFVESYRQISRAPDVRRRIYEVLPWAREMEALFRASDSADGVRFSLSVDPPQLTMDADPDLMCQVLINLMKNAADAARGHAEAPAVSLGFLLTKGGRTQIEVADNGPGIPSAAQARHLPALLHHQGERTGVGLSLARQVVLAHRGSIAVADAPAAEDCSELSCDGPGPRRATGSASESRRGSGRSRRAPSASPDGVGTCPG
jgi:nitrogen fixation/metabolism regulation signal transduction histidine kinase